MNALKKPGKEIISCLWNRGTISKFYITNSKNLKQQQKKTLELSRFLKHQMFVHREILIKRRETWLIGNSKYCEYQLYPSKLSERVPKTAQNQEKNRRCWFVNKIFKVVSYCLSLMVCVTELWSIWHEEIGIYIRIILWWNTKKNNGDTLKIVMGMMAIIEFGLWEWTMGMSWKY